MTTNIATTDKKSRGPIAYVDLFFIFIISAFVLSNLLNIRTSLYTSLPIMALLIITLFHQRGAIIIYTIIFVMTLDSRSLIYASFLYYGYFCLSIAYRGIRGSMNITELIYIIISGLALAIAINAGGNSNYNIVKFAAIYAPIGLLLILRRLKRKTPSGYIILVFTIAVLTSIISKIIYFPNERASIFNGSENIAFFIITILMIASLSFAKSAISQVYLCILYIGYVASTESRTAFASALFFIMIILLNKAGKVKSFVAICGLGITLYFASNTIGVFSELQKQVGIFVSSVDRDGFLNALSLIDIRGKLYEEALELISESLFFGNGSVAPSVFDEEIYGIQMFHNAILDLLVTFGIFGFLLYAIIFIISTNRLFKTNREAYTLSMAAFLLIGFFQPILFNTQAMLVFFLSVAILESGVNNRDIEGLSVKDAD